MLVKIPRKLLHLIGTQRRNVLDPLRTIRDLKKTPLIIHHKIKRMLIKQIIQLCKFEFFHSTLILYSVHNICS